MLRKLLQSANIGMFKQTFHLPFTKLPIAELSDFSVGIPTSISAGYRSLSYFADETVISKWQEDSSSGGRSGYQQFRHWKNGGGTFHESASIGETAVIEYGAIIHPGAVIGENAHIASGTIVGPAVTVGRSTKTGYNVVLSNCVIGDSCVIHNGVCIGQDGFGFFLDEHGEMVKKPQMLKAMVGNHVEIGANSCIDRGSWRDTTIGDHTKIDNLVQIGHNVIIGKYCMLCGQVGIAGSVMIGDNVTFGGRVAVRDHVSIVSKARLAANSCVTKNITEEGDYGGFPAVPIKEWRRQVARQRQLGSSHHQNKYSGSKNPADMLTKPVSTEKLYFSRNVKSRHSRIRVDDRQANRLQVGDCC